MEVERCISHDHTIVETTRVDLGSLMCFISLAVGGSLESSKTIEEVQLQSVGLDKVVMIRRDAANPVALLAFFRAFGLRVGKVCIARTANHLILDGNTQRKRVDIDRVAGHRTTIAATCKLFDKDVCCVHFPRSLEDVSISHSVVNRVVVMELAIRIECQGRNARHVDGTSKVLEVLLSKEAVIPLLAVGCRVWNITLGEEFFSITTHDEVSDRDVATDVERHTACVRNQHFTQQTPFRTIYLILLKETDGCVVATAEERS